MSASMSKKATSKLHLPKPTVMSKKNKKVNKVEVTDSKVVTKETVGEITSFPSFASFEWKIKDYFHLPEDVDFCLNSPPLDFYDATWSLILFPNGRSNDPNPGCMSLCLQKDSGTLKYRMWFTVGLKVHDGSEIRSESMVYDIDEDGSTCGWYNFLKAEDLKAESGVIAPKDVLTVFCNMKPYEYEGLQKLGQNFKDVFLSGEASDVTIYVKNQEFKVHRAVLVARMPGFSAMMTRHMAGNSGWVIKIDDCDPELFKQFLTYLYSGQVDILSANTIFSFHSIAEKYDEKDLRRSCLQYMIKHLSVEIFCDVLSLLLTSEEMDLMDEAVKYFANNLSSILKSASWQNFFKEDPLKANLVYKKAKDFINENE